MLSAQGSRVTMRPMRIFLASLVASGMLSAPTLADDIQSSLTAFGLIGTWSSDCGKDPSRSTVSKVTFAAPSAGGATATAEDHHDGASTTTVYDITESAMDAGEKIGIALHPVTIIHSDGQAATRHESDNLRLVFQKAGARIQLIRVTFEGLPEIEQAIYFDKCPN